MAEDEKKEIDPMFIEKLHKCMLVVYNWGHWSLLLPEVLKHFDLKIYKDFELYQVFIIFMLNWFKYFDQKSDNFLSKHV